MVVLCDSIAAATLVVGYDIFSAAPFKEFATAKYARKVLRVGLAGSTAGTDFEVELKYGADKIANLFNNVTGQFINQSEDMQVIADKRWCAPEAPISLIVLDAANSNPVIVQVEIL